LAAGPLILLYHRVTELPLDPNSLCVTPQHFAEHLEILRQHSRPMRLQQLAQAIEDGNVTSRTVVVTFDDGYADNLYSAKPLLERYDVPATVFVITGYIGGKREFWWDELERLLLRAATLPATLHLKINGISHHWELGKADRYTEDTHQRQRLYHSLCQLLRLLPEKDQQKALDDLFAWSGTESRSRPTHRALSPDEVLRLAEGGLVEVGAHTVSHPVLSALPAVAQQDEIKGSKAHLEGILSRVVTSFAYPYGPESDYAAETVAIVREAGFACACAGGRSISASLFRRRPDRFQLHRVAVRDSDGEAFSRRLEGCFHD
jgi:peptidoglycan/xylan/chitin deacetylase (PgdA/CDA1 family)